jgi:hypothetical protein
MNKSRLTNKSRAAFSYYDTKRMTKKTPVCKALQTGGFVKGE